MEEFKEEDLRIDKYFNSSPGCSVRITHLPTGTIAECSKFSSSIRNKEECIKILSIKLKNL
jgi:protein subunit release factor A